MSYDFDLKSSSAFEQRGNLVSGKDIEFTYRGYAVRAAEAEGDLDTSQFALKGNVNVLGQDHVVRADMVFVDFRSRTFRFEFGEADLKRALLKGRILSDVYLRGARVEGSEEVVTGRDCTVTTCNSEHPHYSLEAGTFAADVGKRLVFKDIRLRILQKTVLSLPRLVIPLDRDLRSFTPDVGNSRDEGYYAKFRLGVPIGRNTGIGKLDLMSKRGVGLGFDYDYEGRLSQGGVRAYTDFRAREGGFSYTFSAKHQQEFAFGEFQGTQEVRQFSYLNGPNNTVYATQLRFMPRQRATGSTVFLLTRNETQSPGFRSLTSNLSLTDRRSWSRNVRTSLQLTLTESRAISGGTTVSGREALDARFQTSVDLRRAVAELDYNRAIPIGSIVNFSSGIDRAPELTIRTDRTRLFGPDSRLPEFTALLAVGNYRDNFNSLNVMRYALDFRVRKFMPSLRKLGLNYDLGFRQGFYSNDTAQYTPSANVHAFYSVADKLTANLRYNYSRQHGFSPLQSDRTGQANSASFDTSANFGGGLLLGGQVGFDFRRDKEGEIAWQSPSVRLEYQPTARFRLRGLANYIPETSSWGNIRLDLGYKAGDMFISAAARYDSLRNRWGNLNLYVDALRWGRLKVSALMLYNGYLERFDSRHLALTYDLHCAEAVLQIIENNTGFRPGREVLFFIRIKAFPFNTNFGAGRLGQPLGTGTGINW